MPALDEAEVIGGVLAQIDREVVDWVVVGDNGSRDGTADVATAAGAMVVREERRGYGSACLKAIAAVPQADILVFLDADGGDDPDELPLLLQALLSGETEIVIGSRLNEKAETGSLTAVQKFGNTLTCALVRLMWGARYTDLGPFRALRRATYERLEMCDPDYGWTIEMQVKAAQAGVKVTEVPVAYRKRQAGKSKVSGTILGSWRAGKRILGYVFEAKAKELWARTRRMTAPGATTTSGTLILFTRFPEPGRTKTRLIAHLGPDGAADLHRALAEHALVTARQTAGNLTLRLEIHHTGTETAMRTWLGQELCYRAQAEGDLGARMAAALDKTAPPVVLMGTDCPDLTPDILAAAWAMLQIKDVVLGPAVDGGYYLIGMRQPHPDLFLGIPWGGDQVLARTRDRLENAGLTWGETVTLADIDRPEDLARIPNNLLPQG